MQVSAQPLSLLLQFTHWLFLNGVSESGCVHSEIKKKSSLQANIFSFYFFHYAPWKQTGKLGVRISMHVS